MRIPYYSADWAALATDGCLESAVELYGIFIYGFFIYEFFIYENLKYVARLGSIGCAGCPETCIEFSYMKIPYESRKFRHKGLYYYSCSRSTEP